MDKLTCDCGGTFEVPTDSREIASLRKKGRYESIFLGVDVGISMTAFPYSCFDCRRRMCLEGISRIISSKENGDVIVNWGEYEAYKYINDVLNRLGVLSGDADGNWIVMSQMYGCLNPVFNRGVNLYFTSPDDAVAFAISKKFARHCHIMRIEQVIAV